MTKREYAEEIATMINGTVKEVDKANGVILTGIEVRADGNVHPIVYIDHDYEAGYTVDEATERIKDVLKGSATGLNMDFFNDFEQIKPMLKAQLYNKKTNAEVFKPAGAPFDDLIIVPYVTGIDIGGANGVIKVKEEHLKLWNVTADEVIKVAEENSKDDISIMNIGEVLGAPEMPMWVISNSRKTCGAYSIIPMLDELKERFGKFAILPSSIHEVLVVTDVDDENMLSGMVSDVNDTQVLLEEQLSDHAYMVA